MNIRIRPVSDGDLLELNELFDRCSERTIYRRFHGFMHTFPEPYFTNALKGDPDHFALVAETPERIVAMASCVALDDETCEIGILVEDDYQRQRVGTRLLEALLHQAGPRTVRATIQHEQNWLGPVLGRYKNIKVIFS
jgi:GNAT superfamily N-acetyltransferase